MTYWRGIQLHGLLALAGALAGAAAAAPARAQESTAGRVVDVVIAASPQQAAVLELALREPLDRLGVRLRWQRVEWFELSEVVTPDPEAPPAVARAWFDLAGISPASPGVAAGPRASLYLADGGWERILVRTVAFPAGLDEIAREELATILLSGVEGILAGEPTGRTREEVREELGVQDLVTPPPPLLPPIEIAPLPGRSHRLELGVSYEPGGFSGEVAATHGLGLLLGAGLAEGTVRWGFWLTGQYRLPLEVDGSRGVGVRLDVGAIRVLGSIELAIDSRFAVQLAAGGGVDIARVEPRLLDPGVPAVLESVGHIFTGVFQALLGLRIVLVEPVSLWLGVGVDIDPSRTGYLVRTAGADVPLVEPWLARPFGALRLTVELWNSRDERSPAP